MSEEIIKQILAILSVTIGALIGMLGSVVATRVSILNIQYSKFIELYSSFRESMIETIGSSFRMLGISKCTEKEILEKREKFISEVRKIQSFYGFNRKRINMLLKIKEKWKKENGKKIRVEFSILENAIANVILSEAEISNYIRDDKISNDNNKFEEVKKREEIFMNEANKLNKILINLNEAYQEKIFLW